MIKTVEEKRIDTKIKEVGKTEKKIDDQLKKVEETKEKINVHLKEVEEKEKEIKKKLVDLKKWASHAKKSRNDFKMEFKKSLNTAIIAAFSFVIALSWRDVISSYLLKIEDLTPLKGELISAIIVTILAVFGILIITRLTSLEK